MPTTDRAPIGSLGISEVELCTNQGCKSIIPIQINNYFLYFVMSLQKENLNVLGNGTTFRELATQSLRNYKIPLPPKEEQYEIASHLFEENQKIIHFIQAKPPDFNNILFGLWHRRLTSGIFHQKPFGFLQNQISFGR